MVISTRQDSFDKSHVMIVAAASAVLASATTAFALNLAATTRAHRNPFALFSTVPLPDTVSDGWLRLVFRVKSCVLQWCRRELHDKFIVLLPPATASASSDDDDGTNAASRENNANNNTAATTKPAQQQQSWSLLLIFPGGFLQPNDYVAMAQTVQQVARQQQLPQRLVVGIGVDIKRLSRMATWALNSGDPRIVANLLQDQAEKLILERHGTPQPPTKMQDIYNVHLRSTVFHDIFVWGHSLGGLKAIRAAYPSKYRALMLYGCSISLAECPDETLGEKFAPNDPQRNNLLWSYPKPVLTMMGERDGNIRCYQVAKEAQALQDNLDRRVLQYCQTTLTNNHVIIHNSNSHNSHSTRRTRSNSKDSATSAISNPNDPLIVQDLKRRARLYKPILILPELNHTQMAMGVLPPASINTGRVDFTSRESLSRAHVTIASVVVDFMQVHSTTPRLPPSTSSALAALSGTTDHSTGSIVDNPATTAVNEAIGQAENRLLKMGKLTRTVYLEPWLRLSDPAYQSRFITEIQRQLLHVTVAGASQQFHFYEDEVEESSHNNDNGDDDDAHPNSVPDIIPHWNIQIYDFLYARPSWRPDRNQISMEVVEQNPISVSFVRQLSKTLAFKGRSQEEILATPGDGKYQEIKDSPAPTLMELNRQTFERVLYHCVTPQQQRRYLQEGNKLKFGPDILVVPSPRWVETPISITKHGKSSGSNSKTSNRDSGNSVEGVNAFYLWQSTYTTTPLSIPAPFGGAWYGKPMSPAQAYEWIVFDAFKPF